MFNFYLIFSSRQTLKYWIYQTCLKIIILYSWSYIHQSAVLCKLFWKWHITDSGACVKCVPSVPRNHSWTLRTVTCVVKIGWLVCSRTHACEFGWHVCCVTEYWHRNTADADANVPSMWNVQYHYCVTLMLCFRAHTICFWALSTLFWTLLMLTHVS